MPQAIHFLPWDYVVLNSSEFQDYYQKLSEFKDNDEKFRNLIVEDLGGRVDSEANLNFVIEEVVVTHLIRQGLIDFLKTLVKNDRFRLIVYPGSYLKSDLY